MSTALTLYQTITAASTVTTADTLLENATTGAATTNKNSTLGTGVTGWGEIVSQGTASAWAAAGSAPAPSGKGWIDDATTLETFQFASGTWTATVRLNCGAGTVTADIHVRAYQRTSGGTYTLIADMVLAGASLTTTATNYSPTVSGVAASAVFATGDKLYIDIVCNVTANTGTSNTLKVNAANSATVGSVNAQIVTPGYQSGATTVTSTITESYSGSEAVLATALALVQATIIEPAYETDTVVGTSIFIVQATIIEPAYGTGTVVLDLTHIIGYVSEFAAPSGSVVVTVETLDLPASQMTLFDLGFEYNRIQKNIIGPYLGLLATTYYGNATNNQVIYGELDALLNYENISQLHVLKTIGDVNTFLTAYEYVANVLTDNPLVYYRLGETSGTAAYDIVRNMTATMVGSPTLGQPDPLVGSNGFAILFNGTTQYIQMPAAVNTANWGAITLEAWINPSNITFGTTARIVANDTPSTSNIGVNLAATNASIVWTLGTGSTFYQLAPSFTFVAATWYHLVATFNGTVMKVYINGSQIGTSTVTSATIAQTSSPMYIARNPGDLLNGFPGTIDEVAIYPTALSAARVLAHYNAGVTP